MGTQLRNAKFVSGTDIGDVTINNAADAGAYVRPGTAATFPVSIATAPALVASEAHIGEVGGNTIVIAPAITVTAGAYHAGDNIGGVLTLANASRATAIGTTLARVSVLDAANQKAQLEILFFSATPASSTFTNNAAPVIHASDVGKYVGRCTVYASDYLTVGAKAVACIANIGLAMIPAATSLFYVILTPGAPTFAAVTDLAISMAFYRD